MTSRPMELTPPVNPEIARLDRRGPARLPGDAAGLALGILSIGLLAPLAVAGLLGGSELFHDPSGEGMGMALTLLNGTPFPDFRTPGIVLFLANGVLPLSVCAAIIVRSQRAPQLVLVSGVVLTVWMGAQLAMIGYELWLQAILAALGLLITVLGAAWTLIARS